MDAGIPRLLALAATATGLAGCTQVYTTPPGGGPLALTATYTTLPYQGTVPWPRPEPSGAWGHDGKYNGSAQALYSNGAECSAYASARNLLVSGRDVTYGPFRGTISDGGGVEMIYGQNTIVGHFEGDEFRGVITFQVPPCAYAMRLVR